MTARARREEMRRADQAHGYALGWRRFYEAQARRALVLAMLLPFAMLGVLPGCGSVVALDAEAAVDSRGSGEVVNAPDTGAPVERPIDGADAGFDSQPPPPRCSSAAADCAPCTLASSAGPGYPAGLCAEIVACVKAGDAGAYPLQSCHNLMGGAADWGGLACLNALLRRDCPGLPL